MRINSLLTFALLGFFLLACKSNPDNKTPNFSVLTSAENNVAKNNQNVELSIQNKKGYMIDSVAYYLDGIRIENNISLFDERLGHRKIEATVYYEDNSEKVETTLTVLSSKPPKVFNFDIINEYPHDITSYTQGLEFYNGILYESTGQYGESKLRKVNYPTAEVLTNIDLDQSYFAEGLTIINDKLYQLTWKSKQGFVYDPETLEKTGSFRYGKSKEGWGLCNDGEKIFKSDGTEKLWILDPSTLAEIDHIQAFTHAGKIVGLNELEWVDGKIYANRYQKNGVAIINPVNGAIEGVIDFTPLRKMVTQHPKLDVLNGIAYNPETNTLFVTGKNWDKLFEVKITE